MTDYLRLQTRFGHLFDQDGNVARPDIVDELQAMADRNVRRYSLLEDSEEVPA